MFKDPFIISSIIIAISFFFVLLLNQKLKNKWIKITFLILSILYLVTIIIFDNNFVNNLLRSLITYIWYPNYLLFIATIIISIIVLMATLFKKKMKLKNKILNYFLFCFMFSLYIIYLRQGIDTSLYSELYSKLSLTILRIGTITFCVWLIVSIIFKIGDRNEK